MNKLPDDIRKEHKVASFYTSQEQTTEAERLHSAAVKLANPISELHLAPSLKEGGIVLDIGAGADHALGRWVMDKGCEYVAVEPNKSFVEILRAADIRAYQGDVTNVPVESNSIQAVHMRFLFGWLNEEQRKSALRQAGRVLRPGEPKTIAVIDYDWLMTDGPDEYMKAVGIACDILQSFGFDYTYGGKLPLDLEELAARGAFGDGIEYEVRPPAVHEINATLGEGLPLLEEAVDSLKEGLGALGDTERIELIDEALRNVRDIDPETEISLPGIVAQTVTITKREPSPEQPKSALLSFERAYEEDYESTSLPGVVKIRVGSELDAYIRRIQAAEYLKEGLLTSECMIDHRGVLREESYPEDLVARSLSFAAMSGDMKAPTAAVRLIETEKSGGENERLRSLPTAAHLGLEMGDTSVFPEKATADGVIEVSAFVRNSKDGGGLIDMARVIVGAAATAEEKGYHTGLMTTQASAWKFLKGIFGEGSFKVLEDLHMSDIPGASKDVNFICLSVDVGSFLDDVREHVAKKKGKSKTLDQVSAMLEAYYAHRPAA